MAIQCAKCSGTGKRNQEGSMNDEKEGWVPIEVPDNLEEMFAAMTSYAGEKVGWCLLCNSPIKAEADMIPGTSTHDCEQGRALEATIKSQKAKSRCKPGHRVKVNHR